MPLSPSMSTRWLDADAHDDEVAFETQPSLCDDGGYARRSLEPGDGVSEDGANTVSAMEVSDRLPDRFAEHTEERCLRWIDGDDVQAFLPERRGDFRADKPHADDDDSTTGHDLFPH